MTCPDPTGKVTLTDGLEVPMGKGVNSNVAQSSLLYNEYLFGSWKGISLTAAHTQYYHAPHNFRDRHCNYPPLFK